MAKIELGRWSEQLRRMAGMAGQEVVSGELAPEISPTFELEGQSVEWNFLKGVRDVYVAQTIPNLAGNSSKWRFRNPADSGVLAVFEYIEIMPENAPAKVSIVVSEIFVDFTIVQPVAVPDIRWGALTTGRSALVVTFDNTVPVGPAGQGIAQSGPDTRQAFRYDNEILVLPGVTLDAGTATANIQLVGSFKWRERPMPILER